MWSPNYGFDVDASKAWLTQNNCQKIQVASHGWLQHVLFSAARVLALVFPEQVCERQPRASEPTWTCRWATGFGSDLKIIFTTVGFWPFQACLPGAIEKVYSAYLAHRAHPAWGGGIGLNIFSKTTYLSYQVFLVQRASNAWFKSCHCFIMRSSGIAWSSGAAWRRHFQHQTFIPVTFCFTPVFSDAVQCQIIHASAISSSDIWHMHMHAACMGCPSHLITWPGNCHIRLGNNMTQTDVPAWSRFTISVFRVIQNSHIIDIVKSYKLYYK